MSKAMGFRLLPYGVATLSIVVALLLMLLLDPWLSMSKSPFLLFFGSVMVSAWYGGREPGIFATFLSALAATYFFINPLHKLSFDTISGSRVLIYIVEGILISALCGELHAAQQRTQKSLSLLKASEAKFRRLVDSNIVGVIFGDIHGAITEANEAFLQMMGYNREDILTGRVRWDKMTPPDLHHLDVLALKEVITFGKHTLYEKEYFHKDGHRVPILIGTALVEDQYRENIVSFILDLSERKQVEVERDQLLVREQQANRAKDEFLAVLSHELRSPLNPILGWSKLLQTDKLDAAKTTQALIVIERNAKLQADLIDDLLDVSKILQGKLSLNVCPVSLFSTIQAAMETVRLAAETKSIQMQAILNPNVGEIAGDPTRLQQVIWNLLSNAVKFTDVGGRVDIQLEQLGSIAQITISDTGKGIHPDFLPYVFDYFRQADATTTRKFGGLGLGLAIVRHLVELHGGTVQADSPGTDRGATFTVRFPLMLTQTQTNQDTQQSEQPLNLNGIKILVVDDDADTREFIAFLLEQYGASVTAFTSASEALAALKESQPDVLLSDIGMPQMDGYTLLRQVRALPAEQGGQIPAIALTAYAGEIDYQQALRAGFQKHISKPVEPDNLVRAIVNLIGVNIE